MNLLEALGQERPVYWFCDDKKRGKPPFERLVVETELAKQHDLGSFFCVNLLGEQKNDKGHLRHESNVLRPLACFADFDTGTLEEQVEKILHSPIEPSAIVKSGRGYHLYWFLTLTAREDLKKWTAIQKSIAKHFGSDEAVSDPARLMRLPGSWHCKGEPVLVTLDKCDPTLRYDLSEIEIEFPIVKEKKRGVETLLDSPTKEGGRNVGATKVVGSMLANYPTTKWEKIAYPLIESWNEEKCVPPMSKVELRSLFDSISKKELKRREAEGLGITTFSDDEMLPDIREENGEVIVRIAVENGVAQFSFTSIEQNKQDALDCVLSVELLVSGSASRPWSQRINLLSGSAMEGLTRGLKNAFGKKLPWELLLNTAQAKLISFLANRDMSIDLSEVPDEGCEMLFDPFLMKNSANLLFGDGGTGKSFFCLRLAISLATGIPFLGMQPNEAVPTLFVDYEDNPNTAAYRISHLCSALGLNKNEVKKYIKYYNPQGSPIYMIIPALKKMIREHHIGLVLVDSVATACGTEPEKAESASRYYNALSALGTTSLSIAHITKTEGGSQDKAFGSVFWHNFARNTWNIQGKEDDIAPQGAEACLSNEVGKQLILHHRKFNNGPKSKPISYRMVYAKNSVRFEDGQKGFFVEDKIERERVLEALRRESMTKNELLEELINIKDQKLKDVLATLRAQKTIYKDPVKGGKYHISSCV
jgi:hypothetical protein